MTYSLKAIGQKVKWVITAQHWADHYQNSVDSALDHVQSAH